MGKRRGGLLLLAAATILGCGGSEGSIDPPPPVVAGLSAVTVTPASVQVGSSATGQVTLTSAAPTGGIVVSLSSSGIAATVPATVTVLAGATTASFSVTTATVQTDTQVTLSAAYSGVMKTTSLTVAAVQPALTNLSLSPTSLQGGASATGTVTLAAPAVQGGAVIALLSDKASASVPATVTVPSGSTSQTFTVTTTAITIDATATISATLGPVTRTATIAIQAPPPALASVFVSPTTVQAGSPAAGQVTLTSPALSGGVIVSLSSNGAAASVPATVTVPAGSVSQTFTVTTSTVASDTPVTLSASYSGVTKTTSLTVAAVQPALSALSISPTSLQGGASATGTVTLAAPAVLGGAVIPRSSRTRPRPPCPPP